MPSDRWDRFFEDLEYQFAAEREQVRGELAGEEERLRIARLGIRDRLVAAGAGARILVEDVAAQTHRVHLVAVGADWLAGEDDERPGMRILRTDAIAGLRLDAATRVRSLSPATADPLLGRMELGFILRALARRRARLTVGLVRGLRESGTASNVGTDHLDLAIHGVDEAPRADGTAGTRTIAFRAIAWIDTASRRDVGVF